MDEKWLESWGNFLIQAARSQRTAKDFFQWLSEGAPPKKAPGATNGLEAWTRLVMPFMPPQAPSGEPDMASRMNDATRQMQAAYSDWISMMGMVPKREYDELAEKHDRLKAKLEEKEETIRQLGQLLALKSTFDAGVTNPLQDMLKSQGEAFQKMMKNCFGVTSTPTQAKGNEQDDDPESTD